MDSGNVSDSRYSTTPLKSDGSTINHRLNPRKAGNPYKTPVQHGFNSTGELKLAKSYKSVIISKMPTYSPPSKNVSFVKNPFEQAKFLKERLSQPVCSPSLFKAVSSPAQNDDFTWSIEDISNFYPADIDENPSQDFNSWFSPVTESEAQEAINKFFSRHLADLDSPLKVEIENKYVKNKECDKSIVVSDVSTQTMMTLPLKLPPDLEAILRTYCIFGSENHNKEFNLRDGGIDSPANKKPLMFDLNSCQTPKGKEIVRGFHESTPVTSRLPSPEISPVSQFSPMDISLRDKSSLRLNFTKDMATCENEISSI